MKKSILVFAAFVFVTGMILTSCNTPAEKVENAEDNVTEAKDDLDQANKDYMADVETYRKASADRIAANEASILEFKARIATQKKEARAEYEKKVAALEQKNTDIKKTMEDYKADGKDNWDQFKMDFNRSMDELGQSIKDMTDGK